jgi:hypothetical protein
MKRAQVHVSFVGSAVASVCVAAVVSASAGGCSLSPRTSDLEVDEIGVFFFVNATDDATEVSAQFARWQTFPECGPLVVGDCGGEGTGDALEVADERVTVTLGEETQELLRDESGGDFPRYTASIAAAQTGDDIVFTLQRADGAAVESAIALPPPPVVQDVPLIFSRRDGLIVSAVEDFGNDLLSADLAQPASCGLSFSSSADNQRVAFSFDGETSDVTCDMTLTVGRVHSRLGNPASGQADVQAQRVLAPQPIRSTP